MYRPPVQMGDVPNQKTYNNLRGMFNDLTAPFCKSLLMPNEQKDGRFAEDDKLRMPESNLLGATPRIGISKGNEDLDAKRKTKTAGVRKVLVKDENEEKYK
jgi:hypothetical protein